MFSNPFGFFGDSESNSNVDQKEIKEETKKEKKESNSVNSYTNTYNTQSINDVSNNQKKSKFFVDPPNMIKDNKKKLVRRDKMTKDELSANKNILGNIQKVRKKVFKKLKKVIDISKDCQNTLSKNNPHEFVKVDLDYTPSSTFTGQDTKPKKSQLVPDTPEY